MTTPRRKRGRLWRRTGSLSKSCELDRLTKDEIRIVEGGEKYRQNNAGVFPNSPEFHTMKAEGSR